MANIFNKKSQTSRRKLLRNRPTVGEKKLWLQLKSKQLDMKFRRQYGIGQYIVDFYCPEVKLVIEVDGSSHGPLSSEEYDEKRQKDIEALGLVVARFTDVEIQESLPSVVEEIRKRLKPPLTPPS